jgi:hypothetical protein
MEPFTGPVIVLGPSIGRALDAVSDTVLGCGAH